MIFRTILGHFESTSKDWLIKLVLRPSMAVLEPIFSIYIERAIRPEQLRVLRARKNSQLLWPNENRVRAVAQGLRPKDFPRPFCTKLPLLPLIRHFSRHFGSLWPRPPNLSLTPMDDPPR